MILGANHVGLSVPDMDKALAFYCDLLGFKKVFEFAWEDGDELSAPLSKIIGVDGTSCNVTVVAGENINLEIFNFTGGNPQAQDPRRPVIDHSISHLCVAVKDLDQEYERLVAAGMEFHSEPVQIIPGIKTVYGRDPFGNVVELEEIEGREVPNQPPAIPEE